MFRFTQKAFKSAPRFRRTAFITGAAAFGIAATTSAVAFASPQKVTDSEVVTAIPSLTPGDLTQPTSYEQAKAEAEAADRAAASEHGGEQRQAYNPETGEIDWDCPCLGGMAHGPCGEEFKEAFSCFVYSKNEIRGSECIPKFSAMQDCFRKYPEVYAEFNEDTETVAEHERAKIHDKVQDVKETTKETASEASNKARETASEAANKARETASEAANKAREAASEASNKAREAASEASNKTRETASEAAKKARETASEASNKTRETASEAAKKARETASEASNKAEETASQAANNVKETASNWKDAADEKLVSAEQAVHEKLGSNPVEKTQEQIGSSVKDLTDSVSNAISAASELASQKTAAYTAKLQEAGNGTSNAIAEYATEAQNAAKQVIEEAKERAEHLNREQLSQLIEEKLNAAHDLARDAFDKTEQNQSALRQTQKFATDAVAGIAAEAKEAVNFVSEQISKK